MAVAVAARGGRGRGLRPGARLECRRSRQAVQPRKVLLPLGRNRGGVVPPALVLVLDEDLVDAEIAIEVHGAREDNETAARKPFLPARPALETGRASRETDREMPGWRNGRRGALKTP